MPTTIAAPAAGRTLDVQPAASTALLTDQYELTMLRAAIANGTAQRYCVFEAFARHLPRGRRYGVVAGLDRILEAVESFTFSPDQVLSLLEREVIDIPTARWLSGFRFTGTIHAYPEGELYVGGSPVLRVEGSFGECVLLETLILSILNHDVAIASAASRMVNAAGGRRLLEMGSRRTHEEAAVAAARAAYVAGFDATSNLQACYRYGVPAVGTSAHAFTLAHDTEAEAFAAQVATLGTSTTLLVDTYDIEQGIRNAVAAAGPALGGVRIDSGDLGAEAVRARRLLDELGAPGAKVVLTGDLDEYRIADLADAPVDVYGVGTRLVTGSGHPTASMVYKLVAISPDETDRDLRPVAKNAPGKASVGGRKTARRLLDDRGVAVGEEVLPEDAGRRPGAAQRRGRDLQVLAYADGVRLHRPTLEQSRALHRRALAELDPAALDLADGPAAFGA
ncbi:nicotinate phosphoribosyltransferase [Nocardioides ochotonae]|uniref:nicotinate phosphoribosyltransferase n=1 Tax=Nocardioides ochotonae TaxID=2685869 RepID=UPI00140C85A8|nr:nicotinate phosphoribosyltransferase [Nocardioides ochotonae]